MRKKEREKVLGELREELRNIVRQELLELSKEVRFQGEYRLAQAFDNFTRSVKT